MENMNDTKGINVRKCSEAYTECSAEYILPDYKGDVKRILHTQATVLPSGCFCDSETAESSGVVVFDVLYLDAENKLTSVGFSSDYTLKFPMKEGTCEAFCECVADSANVRLPGPRKMIARCTVKGTARLCGQLATFASGTALGEEYRTETSCRQISNARTVNGKLADREYAEELIFLDGVATDDVEVVAKRAEIKLESVCADEDSVTVSGEIAVYALLRNGVGPIFAKDLRIPLDEKIGVDGADGSMEAFAKGTVSSLETSVNPTEDGVRVNVNLIADIDAYAVGNERIELVCDAYSPLCEVENEYERTEYDEFIGAKSKNSKIVAQIPKSETDAECASDIVYLSSCAKANGVKIDGSEVRVEGEIRFSGVACEIYEDGTPTYTSIKFSVPFSECVSFGRDVCDGSVEYEVVPYDARVTIDENNFNVECGISLNVSAFDRCEVTRLVSCEALSEPCENKSAYTVSVYYPEEGDTLFEIAKRFKTSPLKIAADNALTEETVSAKSSPESLAAVEKLIIKRL